MRPEHADEERLALNAAFAAVSGSDRRTLDAIFRHPLAHNLEWSDVVALIGTVGTVHEHAAGDFVFELAGQRQTMRKPHTKDLTGAAVQDVRHFIMKAGFSPDRPSEAAGYEAAAVADLVIVVDHHSAKIFQIDVGSNEAAEHVIRPYDPHHFLHHLSHKDQSRERGQRAPEEPAFYGEIAAAVAPGGRIVVVGHGTGSSNAADHLMAYLKAHHVEVFQRVAGEVSADLSAATPHQLLELALQVLRA